MSLQTIADVAAERAVIGAVLSENSSYFRIDLSSDDFSNDAYRIMFYTIQQMSGANRKINKITFLNAMVESKTINAAGGFSFVSSLVEELANPSAIKHYAEIVKNCATRRRLQLFGMKSVELAQNATADEALDATQRALSEIAARRSGETVIPFSEAVDAVLNDVIGRAKAPERTLKTGLVGLDELLHGFHRGEMVIAAARPGVGKTALCTDVAVQACLAGRSVALFSAEMTREAIVGRVLAYHAKVDNWRVQSAQVNDWEIQRLVAAADEARGYKLWIDARSRDAARIRSRCRQLEMQSGLDLVIVDYLQRLRPHVKVSSREQEVAVVSGGLKDIATDLGVPLLVACQLNRAIEHRQDARPALSDLRESGAIEQDADTVLGLSTPDTGDARTVSVSVLKQRNGPLGECKLVYLPRWNQFKDYKPEEE